MLAQNQEPVYKYTIRVERHGFYQIEYLISEEKGVDMAKLTPYFNTEGMKDEFPFILLGIAEGEEVPLLNLDLIEFARRHDWITHHLVDSETNESVNSEEFEGKVPIIPALVSYLLRLNEDAVHFFASLDEAQKGEARRIFQLCLEMIDT